MKRLFCLLFIVQSIAPLSAQKRPVQLYGDGVLYDGHYTAGQVYPELQMNETPIRLLEKGLEISGVGQIKLNKYYSLAERLIRYRVKFSADTKAVFESDKGDFKACIDMASRAVSIATAPLTIKKVPFLNSKHEYQVEIHRDYQTSSLLIIDLKTYDTARITATNNGAGGHGIGANPNSFQVGRQYDYYCFGLAAGGPMVVKQATVFSKKAELSLLLYGDSITEPEGYFPTTSYDSSWTQLVMANGKGASMSSGRGGNRIGEVMERIQNELPYLNVKYVMITIGTNGGNTMENLCELVEYVLSQNAIPILNNIPCNESGTQIRENELIEKVRQKYSIKGCLFDLATSLKQDGKEVDKTMMYLEDYDWGRIYHHPNVKGSLAMYLRTLIDIPEIY